MRALLRVSDEIYVFEKSKKNRRFLIICAARIRRRFQFFNFVFFLVLENFSHFSLFTYSTKKHQKQKILLVSFLTFPKKFFFNLLEKQTYKIKKIELTQQKLIFGLSLFSHNLKQQFMSFKLTSLIINCKLTCFKTTHH